MDVVELTKIVQEMYVDLKKLQVESLLLKQKGIIPDWDESLLNLGNGNSGVLPPKDEPSEKPQETLPYLSFIEEDGKQFDIDFYWHSKYWDGELYYSTDTEYWTKYTGQKIASSPDGKLYMQGLGNTILGTPTNGYDLQFKIDAKYNVQCNGNIEVLLDYLMVQKGEHPPMAKSCFSGLFRNCKGLVLAPDLPATELVASCYDFLFCGCSKLRKLPKMHPEITRLPQSCYYYMFADCTSLTEIFDKFLATELETNCITHMFEGCTNLKGTVHCPESVKNNNWRLDCEYVCLPDTVKVVFVL